MLWGALFAVIVALAGVMFWIRVPAKDWASLVKIPLFGLVASAAILACMALVVIAMWLAHQFRPTHVTLVPHLRARLPQAAALFCATVAVVCALATAAWLTEMRPVLVGLGALGIMLALIVAARSATGMVVLFCGALAGFADHAEAQQWTGAAKALLATPAFGIPVGVAVTIFTVYWTFAMRGDKHMDHAKSTSSMQWALTAPTKAASPTAFLDMAAFKRYLSRRLKETGAPAGQAHLLLALGPTFHWVTGVTSTLLLSCFTAGLVLVLRLVLSEEQPGSWSILVATQLGALGAFNLLLFQDMARTSIHQTRQEQALLVLAERAPSPAAQSRALIPYLLRQYLTVWGFSTVTIIGFGIWTDLAVLEFRLVSCVAFALLPCTTFLIRDYAQDDYAKRLAGWMNGILPVFAINGALILIALLVHMQFSLIWCLGMAVLTAGLCTWRLRRVSRHGELLLPAGRAS